MHAPGEHWPRAILHVDMDAFYASVEILDDPSLRGRPVVVGGTPEGRGVVSAASYAARQYGIHSAMPAATARRLCPQAVFLPGRMARYLEVSAEIHAVFSRFTPRVEPLSVDEAFLDITGSQRLFGPPAALARQVKETVRRETGLTASVGAAPTKFVAKLASDLEKPDGLVVIRPGEVRDRLAPLPVERLWGVGNRTAQALHRIGIRTLGQLRSWPEADLEARFGSAGPHLARLSRGEDPREVENDQEVKSLSHETTFAADVHDAETLAITLRALADKVARRLRQHRLIGRVVQLKVKYADFTLATRRITLAAPSALGAVIAKEAIALLHSRTEAGQRPVRLVGVGMASLQPAGAAHQSTLFCGEDHTRLEALERTTDRIRDRMGEGAVCRAIHLPSPPAGMEGPHP